MSMRAKETDGDGGYPQCGTSLTRSFIPCPIFARSSTAADLEAVIDVGKSRRNRRRRWQLPMWTSLAKSGDLHGKASVMTRATRIGALSDPIDVEDGEDVLLVMIQVKERRRISG